MKKTVTAIFLTSLLFSVHFSVNAENIINKSDKIENVNLISVEDDLNEEDENSNIIDIINDIKDRNISTKDINQYQEKLQLKINDSISSYYNEIKSSLKVVQEQKAISIKNIDERINLLNDKINKTISDTSLIENKDNFESISKEYIDIIKIYKENIDSKIKEKKELLDKEKLVISN